MWHVRPHMGCEDALCCQASVEGAWGDTSKIDEFHLTGMTEQPDFASGVNAALCTPIWTGCCWVCPHRFVWSSHPRHLINCLWITLDCNTFNLLLWHLWLVHQEANCLNRPENWGARAELKFQAKRRHRPHHQSTLCAARTTPAHHSQCRGVWLYLYRITSTVIS